MGYALWRAAAEFEGKDELVCVNGAVIMTRAEWERRNAPWWKRLFMRSK